MTSKSGRENEDDRAKSQLFELDKTCGISFALRV